MNCRDYKIYFMFQVSQGKLFSEKKGDNISVDGDCICQQLIYIYYCKLAKHCNSSTRL